VRSFLAFSVDSKTRTLVADHISSRKGEFRGISWVPSRNLHITVKFLGEIDDLTCKSVENCLQESAPLLSPFSLTPEGGGCFPDPGRARVLFIAYSLDEPVMKWIHRLHTSLVSLGFPKENRPFTAHLTLGRVRRPVPERQIHRFLEETDQLSLPKFEVQNILMMESRLDPGGAIYSVHRTFSLGGGHA